MDIRDLAADSFADMFTNNSAQTASAPHFGMEDQNRGHV
jgi:hypothetical protein